MGASSIQVPRLRLQGSGSVGSDTCVSRQAVCTAGVNPNRPRTGSQHPHSQSRRRRRGGPRHTPPRAHRPPCHLCPDKSRCVCPAPTPGKPRCLSTWGATSAGSSPSVNTGSSALPGSQANTAGSLGASVSRPPRFSHQPAPGSAVNASGTRAHPSSPPAPALATVAFTWTPRSRPSPRVSTVVLNTSPQSSVHAPVLA